MSQYIIAVSLMALSDALLPSLYRVYEKSRYFRIKFIYHGWPNLLNTGTTCDNIQKLEAANRRELGGTGVWVQTLHAATLLYSIHSQNGIE
jgi:hypothetical protein